MNASNFLLKLLLAGFLLAGVSLHAQPGILRGNVIDQSDGAPVQFASVLLEGTSIGTSTDINGFFSLSSLPPGRYRLVVSYLGYSDQIREVEVRPGAIVYQRILLEPMAIELEEVNISAERDQARNNTLVSRLLVRKEQILALPAIGGEADLAQYLSILPGIVSTGDQGGQLYIRGGAPVQNKILLDGMTLFNPFHSIGLFSVFETESIRSAEVHTAGFHAGYGGRVSAVVDIKTREGNTQHTAGLISASPFQVKGLLEGPIMKLDKEGNALSFLLTGKQGILHQTSKTLYNYAVDTSFFSFGSADTSLNDIGKIGLPYTYTDLYGKLSWLGANGSKLDVFGFNFKDAFDFVGLAGTRWAASGAGAKFLLVPPYSGILIDGALSYSTYLLELSERGAAPRSSGVNSYSAQLNFTSLGDKQQLNYGFELTGFSTDFRFLNPFGVNFSQEDFTTELAGFFTYTYRGNRLILEPGIRLHYYASQSQFSPEPRLAVKFNALPSLRFKAAGGLYSQNLVGTVNDLDVVNFFTGFLAGPEETIYQPGTGQPAKNRLQQAWHAVFGLEADIADGLTFSAEPYWKAFTQLIQVNRNKLSGQDPDFLTESGKAYGVDIWFKYQSRHLYGWLAYSLARVEREDGSQVYPTVYDRRHNLNFVGVYTFGRDRRWETALRWNLGSGFPFTQTQGFYQDIPFGKDLIQTDILSGNYPVGVILSDQRNGGRLPFYHRMDISLKHRIPLASRSNLEINASVSNAYNRENVFYVDRLTNKKVNQLPILPALGLTLRF